MIISKRQMIISCEGTCAKKKNTKYKQGVFYSLREMTDNITCLYKSSRTGYKCSKRRQRAEGDSWMRK